MVTSAQIMSTEFPRLNRILKGKVMNDLVSQEAVVEAVTGSDVADAATKKQEAVVKVGQEVPATEG